MNVTIIAIILLIYLLLIIKKPKWALFIIPLLLPGYLLRFKIGIIPFTFVEALIIILVLVWFIKKIIKRELCDYLRGLKNNKFIIPILLFLIAATISIFVSAERISALGIWKAYFIVPVALYFVFIDIIKTKNELRLVAAGLGIAACAVSAYAIVQFLTGWGIPVTYSHEGLRRATSIYQYPAALGLFVAPIFSLLSGILIISISKNKGGKFNAKYWLIIISIIIMGVALLLSRAEGAWAGAMAALFIIFMFTEYRYKIIVLSLILALLVLLIPAARNYVIPLITFQDVSGDVRLAIWQGTLKLIKNHPIFGAGLSGFQTLYAQYKEAKHTEISLYPHNIFLNFWAETGILGLLAVLLLIFQYIRQGFNGIKKESSKLQITSYKIALLAVMVCILVYGLVDVPYFKNDLSILFWIWLSLMTVLSNQKLINKKPDQLGG